jgi:hypothetical protein
MSLEELKAEPAVYWSSPLQQAQRSHGLPAIVRGGFHPTRWGWFPWSPDPWEEMVHPDDRELAERLLPSPRILTVNWNHDDPEYSLFAYGCLRLRLKPSLWREVPDPVRQLGDLVEVSSLYSHHEPTLVTIEEIYWDSAAEKIRFMVSNRGQHWPQPLDNEHLMPDGRVKGEG